MKKTTFLIPLFAVLLAGCGGSPTAPTITPKAANNRLFQAMQSCDDGQVGYWIRQGANPNMRFTDGSTILMNALEENVGRCADVITALIANGADVNLSNYGSGTPLMSAAYVGWNSMIYALLEAGAHINATDDRGRTALMFAVQHGDTGAVNTLMNKGADATIVDYDGNTALSWALDSQQVQIVAILQRHGITK